MIFFPEFMTEAQNTTERIVVGLDLGGTKLAAAIFAYRGNGSAVRFISSLENIKYKVMLDDETRRGLTSQGQSKLIERAMVGAIRELLKEADVHAAHAVGVASAGFVEDGRIIEAMNTGMKNYPLKERLENELKMETFLYKDSWTPMYAAPGQGDCMIFSIGTGFGGVSSRDSNQVSLRSRSARRKPIWIPYLAMNDDPGFAATFSSADILHLMHLALDRFAVSGRVLSRDSDIAEALDALPDAIRLLAKDRKKMSPSKLEMFMARALSPRAAGRIPSGEVFADLTGAADFPSFLYHKLAGQEMTPPELDKKLAAGDPEAELCFFIQAEFIGRVLALMQKERVDNSLSPAPRLFGTGSGFNMITSDILGPAVARAMAAHAINLGVPLVPLTFPETAELLVYSDGPTTLACYGAAVGAARGIVQN